MLQANVLNTLTINCITEMFPLRSTSYFLCPFDPICPRHLFFLLFSFYIWSYSASSLFLSSIASALLSPSSAMPWPKPLPSFAFHFQRRLSTSSLNITREKRFPSLYSCSRFNATLCKTFMDSKACMISRREDAESGFIQSACVPQTDVPRGCDCLTMHFNLFSLPFLHTFRELDEAALLWQQVAHKTVFQKTMRKINTSEKMVRNLNW